MSVFVCRLPIPRWPHFLCGSIHPCPFQTKSIISIWWCSQAGLSEDTAWNWCVSFQAYWGRQLPFGNSLRMLLQHSLSIPAQLFLSRSPSVSDWFTLITFPLSECSFLFGCIDVFGWHCSFPTYSQNLSVCVYVYVSARWPTCTG